PLLERVVVADAEVDGAYHAVADLADQAVGGRLQRRTPGRPSPGARQHCLPCADTYEVRSAWSQLVMRVSGLLYVSVVVGSTALATGCGRTSSAEVKSDAAPQAIVVANVEAHELRRAIDVVGTLAA